ncbi:MAG: peptidase T [Limosilactobacillus sp.]|uniref:peptidase T n=1 Tax=Limosilactobacillus sp. TaxID=2773925 RepID=UPI0026F9FC53|nr:peptidase T [Limosilactobacillus sp.]
MSTEIYGFVRDKFIEYAKINTRSDIKSDAVPTTPGQVEFQRVLERDLKEMGLSEVNYYPADSYLVAKIAGNENLPKIGFVAHVDTADYESGHVNPQVFPDYDGSDIQLKNDHCLSISEFPSLKKAVGKTLITSDGTTLLGTDDKAGIAATLGFIKMLEKENIDHGDIYFAFGPDEEIGKGAKRFDVSHFPVDFCYTLDNGEVGDIAYETFNAASAEVTIAGVSVHPGEAYNLMVNANLIAHEFIGYLPKDFTPENSHGYEGFILLHTQESTVDHATLRFIIRSFDTAKFKQLKKLFEDATADLNRKYPGRIKLVLKDQYYSPGDTIKADPYCVNLALRAYDELGITSRIVPFRGGTDGCFITEKGIPAPNLFNGGANYHGPYEYVTVEEIVTLSQVIMKIVQLNATYKGGLTDPLKRALV